MTIGFIGFGEAGSSIALGLHGEGIDRIVCYDAMQDDERVRDKFDQRCAACDGKKMESAALVCEEADLVFSAVQSNYAVSAAEDALDGIKKGLIFMDVSTATPSEKLRIAEMVEAKGALFVDGAMLGTLLKDKHKVSMLLSGRGAHEAKSMMKPYHMQMEVVEGKPGTATSIKFIRSITAKGSSCGLFESLRAAQKFGVEEIIVNSFLDSYGPNFINTINGYVSGAIIHSDRREHELQNVVDFLKSESLPYTMSEATREKLQWIRDGGIKDHFPNSEVPRNWRGVLDGWGL